MTWLANRYFENGRIDEGISQSEIEAAPLLSIVEDLVPDCSDRVQRSCTTWSRRIRGFIRSETGLQLRHGRLEERIPCRVIPGIPEGFRLIPGDMDGRTFRLWLQRWRIRRIAYDIGFVLDQKQLINEVAPAGLRPVPEDALGISHTWCSKISDWLDSLEPPAVEVLLDPDTLGAYWWHDRAITLHWIPIGIASLVLRVRPEHLVPVVLCHELAHAFHHCGYDIDGRQWRTESFRKSQPEVVEGVAQFYTWLFAAGADAKDPLRYGLHCAWEKLESVVPRRYTEYQAWLPDLTGEGREREIMRAALLSTRMQNAHPVELGFFREAILAARRNLARSES